MLKQSAIKVIKKHVIGEKRRGANDNNNQTSKRQRSATVPTANGADGLTSLHQSTGRDIRLNAAARKKKKCSLEAEAKNIDKGMKALEKRKQQ